MNLQPWIGAVIVAWGALPGPAQNTPDVVLAWKWKKGDTFSVERIATKTQTVDLKGKQQKQETNSFWQMRIEVKEIKKQVGVLSATLSEVRQKVAGAANAELLDPKLAERMRGSEFNLEVAPDGRILGMQGYDAFIQRASNNDKSLVKSLRATLPESAVKEVFADLFGPLPGTKVKPGDTWQRAYTEPIPHFGRLRSTASYTYTGADAGRARIRYAIQTKYEAPAKDDKAIFHVLSGAVKTDVARGAIYFDQDAGRLIEHERSVRVQGTLTIEWLERQHQLAFSSVTEVKVRWKK